MHRANRQASTPRRVLVVLIALAALPFLAGSLLPRGGQWTGSAPMMCRAERRELVVDVEARGETQSSENVEVACEVAPQREPWVMILEVVPEGTHVEPGDFLVRLDSSGLEDERLAWLSYCDAAQAFAIDARNAYETAVAAREEYLHGEFAVQEQQLELRVMTAKEKLRKARQSLAHSVRLAEKGYMTSAQLRADEFAVRSAENDYKAAELEWDVLHNLTKVRRLKQFESTIVTTKARAESWDHILKLRREKVAEIEEKIKKCIIRAPVAGQVVLAHLHHNGHSHMVQPGEETHLGRTLIRLPNPEKMEVVARIREDHVGAVRAGMPAAVTFEALPDLVLQGEVAKVNPFPEPLDYYGSATREYVTIIRIPKSPIPLRPGMTAQLKIRAERLPNELVVPCQAVLKHGDKHYCITLDEQGWQAREVEPGSDNRKHVAIRGGLEEGREVVLNVAAYRDKVLLPELPQDRVNLASTDL
jgi:multidrug resistance efflux pump